MSTPTLLLVDGDPHSRRLMEVSLRKAGYDLLTAPDAETVLALPPTTEIDLIISDTALPGLDGFELRRRLLDHPRWQNLPFVFLTREGQIEDRRRGLELGVEEYLTRPIFVREVVARVQILLQKQSLSASQPLPAVPLEGSLESLGLVDLLQTMQQGQATGLIYLDREEYRGRIYIRHGRVLDARVGRLDGEEAFFRLLRWPEGSFTVDLREVHQRQRITKGLDELLDEGLSLLDRCSALQLRLPVPDPVLRVDLPRLALDLDRIPLQVSDVLRLFDGVRTVSRVVEDSPFPDLETLRATVRLYEQHLLLLAEGEEHDDKRTLSEELNNWLTSVGDERPRGSKSTGAHPSARPRQASSERALRARAGRSRPPGEEPEGRTGTTQVWSLKSRESPRPQSALVEAAPDAPPLADDLEPEPPPDTEELPVFKKISHVAASTAPVVTVPERSEAGEAEGFLEIFTPLPASLSVDATSRPSPEVEVVGTLPPPVLDQGPLPPYVPLASLAEGPRQTEPAAGLPPEIPSRTWLEEQIQLRVAEELQRRVQQEYIQRRVEEEVRRRLLPEQGRGPTAAREPRAVVAGSAHQQLAEGIRGQVEAEERQRLAGQVREQIAAQTRDQQDAFARSLRDQAAALRDPAGDASTPPEPEQERRQRLLEAKEKALEESRRRSELILQQALAEARQAEEERLAAVVEVRLATEEANLAQEVRSEIEQTERRAREEAESLREQARLARQEAEEARARAQAERVRAQEAEPTFSPIPAQLASRPAAARASTAPLDDGLSTRHPSDELPRADSPTEPMAPLTPLAREPRHPEAAPRPAGTPAPTAAEPAAEPARPRLDEPGAEESFFRGPAPEPESPLHLEDDEPATSASAPPQGMLVALLGLLVVVAIGAVLFFMWQAKQPPRPLGHLGTTAATPPRVDLPSGITAPELLRLAEQPAAAGATPPAAAPPTAVAPAVAPVPPAVAPATPSVTPAAPMVAPAPPPVALATPPVAPATPAVAPATPPVAPATPPTAAAPPVRPPTSPAAPAAPAAARPPVAPVAPQPRKAADQARTLFTQAENLRQQGRYPEAARQYQAALQLQPKDQATLVGLGTALYEQRRTAEALRRFREAAAINAGNADAHLGQGMCLQELGRRDEARKAYERFLELAPRHRLARDVRLVLEQWQ